MTHQNIHRAFGVYGTIIIDGKLVVIKKNGGPYINRFDLPGGSLEDGELLKDAINREIHEETGLEVSKITQLGITSFKYPWDYLNYTINQHITVFYEVQEFAGQIMASVTQFAGQDSLGALLVNLDQLNINNASPLVLKAKDYIQSGLFDTSDTSIETWQVLSENERVFGN